MVIPSNILSFSQAASQVYGSPLLGFNLPKTAVWSVSQNKVSYCRDDCHTLSLYLSGGETSFRKDKEYKKGSPDHFCIMPKGQVTDWAINGPISFAHFYITDEQINYFSAMTLNKDVRYIDLEDAIYKKDEKLLNLVQRYMQVDKAGPELLLCEQLFQEILYHLILQYNGQMGKQVHVTGGLSLSHMKIVTDYVHDNISNVITIADLAALVGLSPFHFTRMFKISTGLTTAAFVSRHRVLKLIHSLRENAPLAGISADLGYAHQSHMTGQFKKYMGVTPAKFRKLIQA